MHSNPPWLITGLIWIAALAAIVFLSHRRNSWPFAWMSRRKRAVLFVLTSVSLLLCLLTAAIQAGYENSPTGLRDSEGHALGFNLPLCWELCRMLLANASPGAIANALNGWYGGLYIGMHSLALVVLAGAVKLSPRRAATTCWIQLFLFPTGWFGLVILPFVTVEFLRGEIDGESISEIPLCWSCQPIWFLASALAILWFRNSLGQRLSSALTMVVRP